MSVVAELSRVRKSAKKQGKGEGKRRYKDNLAGHLFLTPWTIGLFGITLFPMAATLYLAFTNYNLLQPPRGSAWITSRGCSAMNGSIIHSRSLSPTSS